MNEDQQQVDVGREVEDLARRERRAGIARGLRGFAELIETTDVPLQGEGYDLDPYVEITVGCYSREVLERAARAVPGQKVKDVDEFAFRLKTEPAPGLRFEWWASRENVCTPRVTGTRTVTRSVPVEPTEYRDVEVEEQIVEWDCGPLLTAATEEAPDASEEAEELAGPAR